MADSSTSQHCNVTTYAQQLPCDTRKDQFTIFVRVSTRMVLFNPRIEVRCLFADIEISTKPFRCQGQAFLSVPKDCQRQLIHDMIQMPDASNQFNKENRDEIEAHLLDVACYCAQRQLRANVSIIKLHKVTLNEYNRARQTLDDWLITSCNNAMDDVINCYRTYSLSGKVKNEIWNEEQEEQCCCSICLNEMKKETKIISMSSCSHKFHGSCILQWLFVNPTCPVCRSEVLQKYAGERFIKLDETANGMKVYCSTRNNLHLIFTSY